MANLNELTELLKSMANGINNFLSEFKNECVDAEEEFLNAKDRLLKATTDNATACDLVVSSLSDIVEHGKSNDKLMANTGEMICDVADVVDDYERDEADDIDLVIGTCANCGDDICDNDEYIENEDGMFCCGTCADEYASEEHEDE